MAEPELVRYFWGWQDVEKMEEEIQSFIQNMWTCSTSCGYVQTWLMSSWLVFAPVGAVAVLPREHHMCGCAESLKRLQTSFALFGAVSLLSHSLEPLIFAWILSKNTDVLHGYERVYQQISNVALDSEQEKPWEGTKTARFFQIWSEKEINLWPQGGAGREAVVVVLQYAMMQIWHHRISERCASHDLRTVADIGWVCYPRLTLFITIL